MGNSEQDKPDSGKPDQEKTDHEKYVYFQPGEAIFVVTHKEERLGKEDLDALIAWSAKKAGENNRNLTIVPRADEELLSFPAITKDYSGSEEQPLQSRGDRPPQIQSHRPFTIVLADVKDKEVATKYVESTRLGDLITQLDNSIQLKESIDKPSFPNEETVLEIVSPNWLSSPSSETGGGGGPGSRPVPFSGKTPPKKEQYEFHLPEKIKMLCSENELDRGKGVIVAILDTAPCMHDLVAAYERWQKVDPTDRRPQSTYAGDPPNSHGLTETLLKPKPDNLLTVDYASYEELLRMRSVHLKDHNYDMTNHGLFVAGIIHSIAPAAEIHLYEVLNPEGVGDLKSIALGLSKVLKELEASPTKRFVINCSLVLNIPLLGHPITDLDKTIKAKIVHEWDTHKAKVEQDEKADKKVKFTDEFWSHESLDWTERLAWLARQAQPIKWICDLIYERNSRVIAAAGNDHEPGHPEPDRPQARYPAAFDSVVGVGALKKRPSRNDPLDHAEYSDRSDIPEVTGITTLGGEKGKDNGVLGIYIGKLPHETDDDKPGPPNECDWAWWAGTSFASPIISGVTAAVLSNNKGWTTQQAIKALYDAQAITIAPWGEDVLDVTQG